MTKRRRAANPMFSKPLTKAEQLRKDTGKDMRLKPVRYILCSTCGRGGGTLVQDGSGGYRHQVCPRIRW